MYDNHDLFVNFVYLRLMEHKNKLSHIVLSDFCNLHVSNPLLKILPLRLGKSIKKVKGLILISL